MWFQLKLKNNSCNTGVMYTIAPRGISPGQYFKNIIMDLIPVSWGQMSRVRCHDDIGISSFDLSSAESTSPLRPWVCQILGLADDQFCGRSIVLRLELRSLFTCFVRFRHCRYVFFLSVGTRCMSSLTVLNIDVSGPSLESMIRQGSYTF